MNSVAEQKRKLQESEYRLPLHWLLRKSGLIGYLRKTELMAEMIKSAGVTAGRALDVGCGDGRGTFELSKILGDDFVFVGIDFSERAIAFAKLMAPEIEFHVQDGKALPYEPAVFSLVVAREVIEHIPEYELDTFLLQIHRVLEPHGRLLITTPSELRRVPPKHFQHFSSEKLERLLTKNGFVVEDLRGFGWWPSPSIERLYRRILSLPALWRVHVILGTHEMPVQKADCLLVLASKR